MNRKNRKQAEAKKAQAKAITKVAPKKAAAIAQSNKRRPAPAESLSPAEQNRVANAIALSDEQKELNGLNAEIEQLQVQLAGCGVAALGGTLDAAKEGDYGWSSAYQDCLNLRLRLEEMESDFAPAKGREPAEVTLIGFLAVSAKSARHMLAFPVISTFGSAAPEHDLKARLSIDGDWQGFRVLMADERLILEAYKP